MIAQELTQRKDDKETEPEPSKKTISLVELAAHLSEDTNISWVKLSELLEETFESCVDGREDKGIVGTAGGNAGELVLFLAAYEQVQGVKLSQENLEQIIQAYFENFGAFYMHTDDHSLDHILQDINQNESVKLKGRAALHAEILSPSQLEPAVLLSYLMKPENIGCGHMKLMATNSEVYGVRREVVMAVVSQFYLTMWKQGELAENMVWVSLPDDHEEGAVTQISVSGKVDENTEIPTISPLTGGTSMFTAHPQAMQFIREKAVEVMAAHIPEVDEEQLLQALTELGQTQLMETVSRLADGLPIYSVEFTNSELSMIRLEGVVGQE